jgi:hypothetical protein
MFAHHLTGKEVFARFQKYGVFDYLERFGDILHTTGEAYLVDDIDQFIAARQIEF